MQIESLNKAEYGDILLFNPIGWYSNLQVFIDSIGQKYQPYSHVALYLEKVGDTHLMIESTVGGVHITKVQEWRNYAIARPDKFSLRRKEIVVQECGKAYDLNLIWTLLKNRLFGIKIDPNDDTRPICSEFVNQSYNYQLDKKGYTTPVTLANKYL